MKVYLKHELHKHAYDHAGTQPYGMCVGRINPKYPIYLIKVNRVNLDGDTSYLCRYTLINGREYESEGYILLSQVYRRHANGKRTGKRKRKLKQRKGTPRK